MDIVLNEVAWAENALNEKVLGKRPSETLGRVAKYYIHTIGKSQRDTRAELEKFLIACDPYASIVTWDKALDRAVKYGAKYPPVVIDKIDIMESEISIIDSLDSTQIRRLAFTLLCVSKYMKAVNPDMDYWVSTPDKDIMRLANINTSIKRQSMMYGKLRDAGLIRFSKRVDNLSIRVLFASDSGKVCMEVSDFRNLGNMYMMRTDHRYYKCECCGLVCKEKDTKTRGRKRKYCAECAVRVKTRQSVNSVMNKRRYINGLDNPYVVYMHVFPDGKKYIGVTSQSLSRRWSNGHGYDEQPDISMAIATYGWSSVEHYLLWDNLTKDQAAEKMMDAVMYYKTYIPEFGYNKMISISSIENFAGKSVKTGGYEISPIRLDDHGRYAC